jgi:hypothetical protein
MCSGTIETYTIRDSMDVSSTSARLRCEHTHTSFPITLLSAFAHTTAFVFSSMLRSTSAVLVFGERASNNFMATALRQILEGQYPNGASVNVSQAAELSPVPAFAGSQAMAMTDWRMEDHMRERTEQG